MPKLLGFLPCEKAIVSKDDDHASLITVAIGLNIALPEAIIGKDVLLPHQWAIFCFWMQEPGDDGLVFQQRIEYVSPKGKVLLTQDANFSIPKITHTQIGRVGVLPIESVSTGDSKYTARLSLKGPKDPDFKVVAEFPMYVSLKVASSVPVAQ